jgi:hypothetical protein
MRAGRGMSKERYSKPDLAYRLVTLLQLGSATYCRFPLLAYFATFKSANISETARAVQGVSTEHAHRTDVGLSIGQIAFARWRRLPPISVNDRFSSLLQVLIIRKH